MRVDVLCFGILKDSLSSEREAVQLAEGSTVGALLDRMRERGVVADAVWGTVAVAVNREYSGLATVLHESDEVALLPPVSGGGR